MSHNQTLQKYTVVTQLLKDYPVDCHDLVESVGRLTSWTLVFVHQKPSPPPTSKYIKGIVALNKRTNFFIVTHSSREFSVVIMDTKPNLNKILNRANNFATQYNVRLIQRNEEPAPERTFSASSKVSELADLQCYLKAYFYKICDEKVDELARERRMWREGRVPPATPDPKADKTKSKKARRGKRADQDLDKEKAGYSGHHRASQEDHSSGFSGRQGHLPNRFIPPFPVPNPPKPSNTRKRFRSPSPPPPPSKRPRTSIAPSFTHNQVNEQLPTAISGRFNRQLVNIAFRDALQVVLSGMPLLKELSNVERTEEPTPSGSPSQGDRIWSVPGLALLDPGIADQYENVIRLRRAIDEPSDPRLVAYGADVQAAITQALERIRRGE